MPSNTQPCPIWGDTPSAGDIPEAGSSFYSSRAGGGFWLEQSGASLLQRLTDRQKANLSHWIYLHNLRYRRFDASPVPGGEPPVLDQIWVEGHRDHTPSSQDRLLTFLSELIRSDDAGEEKPREELLLAAGGCRHGDSCDGDLGELYTAALNKQWCE